MILKRIKQFLCIGLVACSMVTSVHTVQGMTNTMPAANMPQDPQAMMAELEKAAQEIDSFVKSLPENEQKEFYAMVEKIETKIQQKVDQEGEEGLAKLLSNPQEFERFMEEISTDVVPQQEPLPIEKVKTTQKKAKTKITPKQQNQEDQAIDLINTVVKKTNTFLVKIQGIPEFASKVERWGKAKRIYDWQPGLTWQTVKNDIEKFVNKINMLSERDPKSNKYKYLGELIKDESLYNNLAKLRTNLVEYEEQIDISPFGIEKMSNPVKNALQKTISAYTESLYQLNVNDAIDKIIATYEPRAKKLTAEEKAAQERAEQESKRPRPTGRVTVAGRAEDYGAGYYSPESYDSDYGYYGAPSTYDSNEYYSNTPIAKTKNSTASSKPASMSGAGEPGKKQGTPAKDKKEDKEGKKVAEADKKKKTEEKESTKKDEKKPQDKTETLINYELDKVEKYLEQSVKAMNTLDIDAIAKKQVDQTKDSMEKDSQDTISFVQKNLAQSELGQLGSAGLAIEELQKLSKSYTPLRKKGIQTRLTKILNKRIRRTSLKTGKIEEVSIKQSLNEFAQKIDSLEQGINDGTIKIPTYKQYLLFGKTTQEPANDEERALLETVRQAQSKTLELYLVRDTIKTIEQLIEGFAQDTKKPSQAKGQK
ncbi:MAG TPA: hypothetical protein PLU71_01265 [Candidatus Dependentiae bacterium]|nr:hypothetical protein [Candidatus Dependentiae bacterium]HRQ62460.1 hypothetical protein [Candidatus Dependentiae bacterium]